MFDLRKQLAFFAIPDQDTGTNRDEDDDSSGLD